MEVENPLDHDIECPDKYVLQGVRKGTCDGSDCIEAFRCCNAFASESPTAAPTAEPTATPTAEPTVTPTAEPTSLPTRIPTAGSSCPSSWGSHNYVCGDTSTSGHGFSGDNEYVPQQTADSCRSFCLEKGVGGCCEFRSNGACNFKRVAIRRHSPGHFDTRSMVCSGPPSVETCSSSDDCGDTEFCWSNICRDTNDFFVCAEKECVPTDDGWTWTSDDLYTDGGFQCVNRPDCAGECPDDTYQPNTWRGSNPKENCEHWWANDDWGANRDCDSCLTDWARAECGGTCCSQGCYFEERNGRRLLSL